MSDAVKPIGAYCMIDLFQPSTIALPTIRTTSFAVTKEHCCHQPFIATQRNVSFFKHNQQFLRLLIKTGANVTRLHRKTPAERLSKVKPVKAK